MNKIVSIKDTSAIFLATVLMVGTIAAFSTSFVVGAAAQTESYYYEGMDNRYDSYRAERENLNNNNYEPSEYPSYSQDYNREYPLDNNYKSKDSSNTIIKKVKCNNINSNNNFVDANAGIPSNDALVEAQAEDESQATTANGWGYGERNGYKQNSNDFKFVCINNNNNEVVVINETTPVPPPEPTITCEECFEESIPDEALAILTTNLEGGIPIFVDGQERTINSLAELCAALQDATLLEAFSFFQRELNALLAISLLVCLDDVFDFENPDIL